MTDRMSHDTSAAYPLTCVGQFCFVLFYTHPGSRTTKTCFQLRWRKELHTAYQIFKVMCRYAKVQEDIDANLVRAICRKQNLLQMCQWVICVISNSEKGTMVTYGGMSRKPITIPTVCVLICCWYYVIALFFFSFFAGYH